MFLKFSKGQNNMLLKFEHINTSNGLSNNNVNCIFKDSAGFMWFGTEDGLNKYDGSNFKIYRHESKDSLTIIGNVIKTISGDNNGKLWLGVHGWGLSNFNPNNDRSNNYKANSNGLCSNTDTKVFNDQMGNTWVKNSSTLLQFNPVANLFYKAFNVYKDSSIIYSTVLNNSVIWMNFFNDCKGFDIQSKKTIPSIFSNIKDVKAANILTFLNDSLVLGKNWLRGLYIANVKTNNSKHFFDGINVDVATIINLQGKKQLWLGTNNGLYIINYPINFNTLSNKNFINYKYNQQDYRSLSSNEIKDIYQDNAGIIWLATTKGIDKFNPNYLFFSTRFILYKPTYNKKIDYKPLHLFIEKEKPNSYWLSYWHGNGLIKTDSNFIVTNSVYFEHHLYDYKSKKRSENVSNVFRYGKDTLCIASWAGIVLYNDVTNKIIKKYKLNDVDKLKPTYSKFDYAAKDKQGNIWVGTYNQCLQILNPITNQWTTFKQGKNNNETKKTRCNFLLLDSKNRMWLSEFSYYNFSKKIFVKFDVADNANHIFEDSKKRVWMATDVGLARFDEATNEFVFYTTKDGLKSNIVLHISEDKQHNIWAKTMFGLVCLNNKTNTIRAFTTADGLASNETGNFIYKLPNNNFLLTDEFDNREQNAFYEFNPLELLNGQETVPFHITAIEIYGKERKNITSLDSIKKVDISYKENFFTIYFKALEFGNNINIRYRYKLVGANKDWINIGTQNNITFSNLGFKNYTLQLQSTNAMGIWMNNILKININVLPPFWKTNWFIYIAILMLMMAIITFFKHRVKSIKSKAALTQQLTQLELKALRSQMNPHFIFNCLSSIQATMVIGEIDIATEYLNKFSVLLRSVLNQSERQKITLQEEINYLTTYLELECFRYDNLQFKINAVSISDAAFIHIPSMLLQPFIENAIQHGLSHKVGNKLIEILFTEKNNFIEVSIKDNGIGRSASKEINKNRTLAHQSLGIKNIEERLKILFKNDIINIVFVDELEGTEVIVAIPIIG